jgi:hypothetical protein
MHTQSIRVRCIFLKILACLLVILNAIYWFESEYPCRWACPSRKYQGMLAQAFANVMVKLTCVCGGMTDEVSTRCITDEVSMRCRTLPRAACGHHVPASVRPPRSARIWSSPVRHVHLRRARLAAVCRQVSPLYGPHSVSAPAHRFARGVLPHPPCLRIGVCMHVAYKCRSCSHSLPAWLICFRASNSGSGMDLKYSKLAKLFARC